MNIADKNGVINCSTMEYDDLIDTIKCNNINSLRLQAKQGGTTPLICRVAEISDISWLKTMIDKGADVNTRDTHGFPVLRYAIDSQDPKKVSLLLKHGADVNIKGKSEYGGGVLLHSALDVWSFDMVKMLIEAGANVNNKNAYGDTVFHHINPYSPDFSDVAIFLLKHGASVDDMYEAGFIFTRALPDGSSAEVGLYNFSKNILYDNHYYVIYVTPTGRASSPELFERNPKNVYL